MSYKVKGLCIFITGLAGTICGVVNILVGDSFVGVVLLMASLPNVVIGSLMVGED